MSVGTRKGEVGAISRSRFVLALLVAMLSAALLFVFWLYVLNAFFGFARTTSPEGSALLATLAMQLAPAVLVLISAFLPLFVLFALGPALIACLVLQTLGIRAAPGFAAAGAIAALAALGVFQIADVALRGAGTPVLSFGNSGLPAILAGACGGLAAWGVAFGFRPRAQRE